MSGVQGKALKDILTCKFVGPFTMMPSDFELLSETQLRSRWLNEQTNGKHQKFLHSRDLLISKVYTVRCS